VAKATYFDSVANRGSVHVSKEPSSFGGLRAIGTRILSIFAVDVNVADRYIFFSVVPGDLSDAGRGGSYCCADSNCLHSVSAHAATSVSQIGRRDFSNLLLLGWRITRDPSANGGNAPTGATQPAVNRGN
jgi:hypothetical protein